MLHESLRNQIQVGEIRILYDSKYRLQSFAIRNEVRKYIRELRLKYNGSKLATDPLAVKLKKYSKFGSWMAAKSKELDKRVFDQNKTVPNDSLGKYRSIEFELVFKGQKQIEEFAKDVRRHRLTDLVTIKEDGSLRADEDDPNGICREVCITYKTGDEQKVIDLCSALYKRAYVNNSCGTHVHFDMRDVDEKTVKQYGHRLARCVPALRFLLPKSRRTNKHCLDNINDFHSAGPSGGNARYSFVNLQAYVKYKTIEVRGHSGTLNAEKILNWIKLCEFIMASRKRPKPPNEEVTDPVELIKLFGLDKKLGEYVKERYNKFNTPREFPVPEGPPADIPPGPGVMMDTVI